MSKWKFHKLLNLLESSEVLSPEKVSTHISSALQAVLDIDSNDITTMPGSVWKPSEATNKYVYEAKFFIYYLNSSSDYFLTFTISSPTELYHDDIVKTKAEWYGSAVKVQDEAEDVDELQTDFETKSNSLLEVVRDIKTYLDGFGGDSDDDEDIPWSPDSGGWEEFDKEMEEMEIIGARLRK